MLAAACTKETSSGAAFDATYDVPPGRTVVEDLPDGFFTPRDSGAADVPSTSTGSPPLGGDGGPPGNDGPQVGDGGVVDSKKDGPDGAGAAGCDIIRQSCPSVADGCYPGSNGVGVCRVAGGRAENIDCEVHEDCLPGYLCAEAYAGGQLICMRACDPRTASTCPGGRGCRVYSSTVGTCAL